MSMTLAVQDQAPPELLTRELNDTLRMELGWEEVGKGLTRILMGYGLWIAGIVVGLMITLSPLIELGSKAKPGRTPVVSIGHLWAIYAGLGLISVVSIFANGMILTGLWKCLINTAERNWGRWWVFICLVSLAMGPALSFGAGFGGLSRPPQLARGAAGMEVMRYTTIGVILQLSSFGFTLLHVVSFSMFLQAAAQCMASPWHIRICNLFLAFFVPLALVSAYLAVKVTVDPSQVMKVVKPIGFVILGWGVALFFWLTMMAMVRSCILYTMSLVKTPMEYGDLEAKLQSRNWHARS